MTFNIAVQTMLKFYHKKAVFASGNEENLWNIILNSYITYKILLIKGV